MKPQNHSTFPLPRRLATLLISAALLLPGVLPLAGAAENPTASQPAADVWKYQSKRLERAEVDAWLAKPDQVLVLDVRRPDELIAKGSFAVYLNVQIKDLAQRLAFIPKERAILTVSNHAHRAGEAADLLASKGFTVAGATGSEDYEAQGGKQVVRVAVPPPKAATTATAAPGAAR
jgi:rhodanese-related sulfurtransferase